VLAVNKYLPGKKQGKEITKNEKKADYYSGY